MASKAKLLAPAAGELYYRMPESDHDELARIRDELTMLAQLASRDCCDREEPLPLSATALAHCFARFSWEIGEIVGNCLSPSGGGLRRQ